MGFAEVPLETHGEARVVLVDGASTRARSTEIMSTAGGSTLRDGAKRGVLTWSITSDDGSAIRLAETWIAESLDDDTTHDRSNKRLPRSHVVRLVFPRALHPMATVVEQHSDPNAAAVVAVVDAAGVVYKVNVPSFAVASRRRAGVASTRDAQLAALSATDVTQHDISASLATLEGPTAMCAVGTKLIAVGGTNGHVALLDSQTFELITELKPATLARLWNAMAGPSGPSGASRLAIRGLRMIPRETRESPVLLATVREDCHMQVWDVTAPARPASVLGAALPAAAAVFGGVTADGGDGMGARAVDAMHVADGYLAVATRDTDIGNSIETGHEHVTKNQSAQSSKLSVYRLDVGTGNGIASPTVKFRTSVDVPGGVLAVSVCDGALWSLTGDGAVRGWSLDELVSGSASTSTVGPAAFGLDDAADALAAWDPNDPSKGSGAAFALLGATATGDSDFGEKRAARAIDVASDLTNEIAARGAIDPVALRDALAELRWPRTSASGGVLAAAAAAVVGAAGGPDASAADAVAAWASLAPAYATAWRRRNAPLGLVSADVGGGHATIVVRGGSVGVARPLDDVETFVAGACEGDDKRASPATQVNAIGAALDSLLGAPASRALDLVAAGFGGTRDADGGDDEFTDVVASVTGAQEDWLDVATAHAFGRVSPAPRGGMDDVARAALATRRAAQRRAAATTRAAIVHMRNAGATPASAAQEALDAVEWRERSETERDGAMAPDETLSTTLWTTEAEAQSARQHADARANATRAVLMLIGACRHLGARLGVSSAEITEATALVPRAVAAHRAALLARWLVSTPCAGAAAKDSAPDPPPPLAAAVAGWTSEVLHRSSVISAGPTAALTACGRQKSMALVLGGGGICANLKYEGAYVRAVEVGAELYAVGELDALGVLIAATRASLPCDPSDPAPDAPALSFLRGLRGAAMGVKSSSESTSNSTRKALGFFHRAACGISESDSAETTSTDPLLGHLVELLRSIMSGFSAVKKETPGGFMEASTHLTKLEYYETLMLFFERLGNGGILGAAECAHAALREVSEDDDTEENVRRSNRLWANLLQYSLDLGKFSDAYVATVSVPDVESSKASLRKLVAAAFDGESVGGGAQLVSLPVSGDRLVHVVKALEAKGMAMPDSLDYGGSEYNSTQSSNPYLVLYALWVGRGELNSAAGAALKEARRLQRLVAARCLTATQACATFNDTDTDEAEDLAVTSTTKLALTLESLVGVLLCTLNALRLCAPDERGVKEGVTQCSEAMDADIGEGSDTEEEEKVDHLDANTHMDVSLGQDVDPSSKRRRRKPPDGDKTSVAQVKRLFVLSAARLELLAAGAEPGDLCLGDSDDVDAFPYTQLTRLVTTLVQHARFESAVAVATNWTEGEQLTKLLSVIAATVAARAALAQMKRKQNPNSYENSYGNQSQYQASGFVSREAMISGGLLGFCDGRDDQHVDVKLAWQELRKFLEKYDCVERNFQLSDVAARAILATSNTIRLPQWLTARFIGDSSGGGNDSSDAQKYSVGMARRSSNPTALLRLYVANDRIEEAARVSISELSKPFDSNAIERSRCTVSWFPEPLLLELCDRIKEHGKLKEMGEELERVMQTRTRMAEGDSAKLAALSA